MAPEPASFLDVAGGLVSDPAEKAAFADDPEGYVGRHGLDELSPGELHEALGFVADSLPAPLAAQISSIDPGVHDGIGAIVRELSQLVGIDPDDSGDLGLGDDPLDGFDAEEPGGMDLHEPGGFDEVTDSGFDLADADAGDADAASFGKGSDETGPETGPEPGSEPELGDDLSAKLLEGDAEVAGGDEADPAFGLDDSFAAAVPPVTHLDDEGEPEDTFDETDWDDSVDI